MDGSDGYLKERRLEMTPERMVEIIDIIVARFDERGFIPHRGDYVSIVADQVCTCAVGVFSEWTFEHKKMRTTGDREIRIAIPELENDLCMSGLIKGFDGRYPIFDRIVDEDDEIARNEFMEGYTIGQTVWERVKDRAVL